MRRCEGCYYSNGELIQFHNGIFHQLGCDYEEFESGPGNYSIGIVELETGQIITTIPEHIKFSEPHTEAVKEKPSADIVTCGECKYRVEHHYEEPGEKPYIKVNCGYRYGLTKDYQVDSDDFCSRGKRKNKGGRSMANNVRGLL